MKKTLTSFLLLVALASFSQTPSSIEAHTKNMKPYHGYFSFWWDESNGKIWLQVDKINQEFLYVTSLPAGLGSNDIGLDRGKIGDARIVYFQKIGNKLLLVQPNYDYRASSKDLNEQKAVKESFAQSVLASFHIEAQDSNKLLVDATAFLTRDAQNIADQIKKMRQGSYAYSEARSAIYLQNTKNFELNTEFEAMVSFVGGADAGRFVTTVTPSAEAITLRMHHSFVQLPDQHYQPRRFDIRAGYFGSSYFDYSSPFSTQIQQLVINRHRLIKKNPDAAKSEALNPIIYYLDNGTPEPIRSALMDGAKWWNQAFESAGFINAFQVKMLPDDADPMDIRYNMINWVHRSTRGWSYGASIIDPRTGEIIKGQVTLGSLRVRQDYLIFTALLSPFQEGSPVNPLMQESALQRLRQLAAHEVGHTLGLQHNYASSFNNRASVMDYPHPNIRLGKNGQLDFSQVYTHEIGEWDKRAIQYGYAQFNNPQEEQIGLQKLLSENTQNGLLNIADLDARAAAGFHPKAHLWDNGNDAITELKNVLAVRAYGLKHFSETNIPVATPMAKLEDALVPLYNYHRYQLEAVCKLVGGMDYSYQVRGDAHQTAPSPLPNAIQWNAANAAIDCLSPSLLAIPENILQIIPPRPPMYYEIGELFANRTGIGLDPLAAAEALTNYTFSFLLLPERANRLVQLKASKQSIGFDDLVGLLIEKTWKNKVSSGLESTIQMQTQQMLISWLIGVAQNEQSNYLVKGICFQQLQNIKKIASLLLKNNPEKFAHFQYAINRIDHPKDTPLPIHKEMAPGAPIGCDFDNP